MMAWQSIWIGAFCSVLCGAAFAAQGKFQSCLDLFPNRTPPVVKEAPQLLARDLCFDSFAALHSGTRKTPIYAVEVAPKDRAPG